jgi:phosphomannomutase
MFIDPTVFKAYDIRGQVPTSIHPPFAQALGKAFGMAVIEKGESVVAVGHDGRLSSPSLSQALIQSLASTGLQVLDLGLVTTPMLYFATTSYCYSGIQVTGSHNPKDYNGFKMVLAGQAIYGDTIQQLHTRIQTQMWVEKNTGAVKTIDIQPQYLEEIKRVIHLARPLKIIIDSGNGVAGASAPDIFRAIGCEVEELFSEVNGNFPHHHPDPSKPENLEPLKQALQNSDAELGLAFDGDGDRLGIVTPEGQNIFPDRQLILFAQDILQRKPGSTILFDVKCSQNLSLAIQAAGGKPYMYKTGHSLIKAKMRELHAPLGGEMSGHIFFAERWFGFDDGTYAGCRLLEILSRSQDMGAILHALPMSYTTPELNIPCKEGEPHNIVKALQQKQLDYKEVTTTTIDGLRIDWADGFGLIRASNTTPVLVLRFEGHTQLALNRIQETMLALLRTIKPEAQIKKSTH